MVKKRYGDVGRFRECKRGLLKAALELIEIPHVPRSGKNAADRFVDALDLCTTKRPLTLTPLWLPIGPARPRARHRRGMDVERA